MLEKRNFLKAKLAPTLDDEKSFLNLIKETSKVTYTIDSNSCKLILEIAFQPDIFKLIQVENQDVTDENHAFFPEKNGVLQIDIQAVTVKNTNNLGQLDFKVSGIVSGKLNNTTDLKLRGNTTGNGL